jgi:hypothetical protein
LNIILISIFPAEALLTYTRPKGSIITLNRDIVLKSEKGEILIPKGNEVQESTPSSLGKSDHAEIMIIARCDRSFTDHVGLHKPTSEYHVGYVALDKKD